MPYRITENTRRKKDARRVAIMQAAIRVFAEQGYHAATVRDIVRAADVSVGTFYVYFPDKETLFVRLFEETARFLLHRVKQAQEGKSGLAQKTEATVQAYLNVALYEPAVFQLILVSGPGSITSLSERQIAFRNNLISSWEEILRQARKLQEIPPQDLRKTAEGIVGALDSQIYGLLASPINHQQTAVETFPEMVSFCLGAAGYRRPG